MSVTIGALRESTPREMRVSLVPEVTDKLLREGARVLIERTAGERAGFPDVSYRGVDWAASASEVLQSADVLLTVQPLSLGEIAQLRASAVLVGFMWRTYWRSLVAGTSMASRSCAHRTTTWCSGMTPTARNR